MVDELKVVTNVNIIATEKYIDDKLVNFDTDMVDDKHVVRLTQAEYDALGAKYDDIVYFINVCEKRSIL